MNVTISQLSSTIYSKLGCDADLADLVEMYVDEMPQRVAELKKCHDAHTWQDLGRLAHQIKGSAGSYGFDQVTPFALQLEMAAKNGQPEADIEAATDALIEICLCARAGAPD